MMKTTALFRVLSIICLLMVLFGGVAPALAKGDQGGDTANLEGALAEVLEFITGLATSIIRLLLSLGVALAVFGVVFSATKGAFYQALGNSMGVSSSYMTAITVIGCLIFGLVVFGLSKNISVALTEKFVTSDMSMPDIALYETSGVDLSANPETLLQDTGISETVSNLLLIVIRFMISVGVIAFFVATARGALTAQFGAILGGPGVSHGIMTVVGAVVSLLILVLAFPLTKALVASLAPHLVGSIQIPVP
jgi:hypothetical protein